MSNQTKRGNMSGRNKTQGKPATEPSATTSYAVPAANHASWATITCNATSYEQDIATLRQKFASRSGAVWVKITPVINGTSLLLCMDGKSLYLNAICGKGGTWYYFNDAIGAIPSGATKAKGGAHYSLLQPTGSKSVNFINKVVASVQLNFDGNTTSDEMKRNIWLLVTFTSEACRFTSVCTAMKTYLETMTFALDSVEETVKGWATTTGANADIVIGWQK